MTADPVVVTGAASGIGAALVSRLTEAGVPVLGVDRQAGPGVLGCDLASPEEIERLLAALPARLAGLANVAGVPGTAAPALVLRVDALGPLLLAERLAPRIVAGGAVVNVASLAAHRSTQSAEALAALRAVRDAAGVDAWLAAHPIGGPAAYDTAKRVLVDASVVLSARWQGSGVRCLSVSPGPVETPILGDFVASMGAEAMQRSVAAVGRHGRSDEVAAVVAFALSPDASWLNGIDIPVDGGLTGLRAAATLSGGVRR